MKARDIETAAQPVRDDRRHSGHRRCGFRERTGVPSCSTAPAAAYNAAETAITPTNISQLQLKWLSSCRRGRHRLQPAGGGQRHALLRRPQRAVLRARRRHRADPLELRQQRGGRRRGQHPPAERHTDSGQSMPNLLRDGRRWPTAWSISAISMASCMRSTRQRPAAVGHRGGSRTGRHHHQLATVYGGRSSSGFPARKCSTHPAELSLLPGTRRRGGAGCAHRRAAVEALHGAAVEAAAAPSSGCRAMRQAAGRCGRARRSTRPRRPGDRQRPELHRHRAL